MRYLLVNMKVVALPEKREEVRRMIREVRKLVPQRDATREDRRYSRRGHVTDRGRVPIPDCAASEAGEVRIPRLIDLAASSHDRAHGKLVQNEHHHRHL